MPTLKDCDFKEIFLGPSRTCPECEEPELEITADLNIFECNFCGAKWHRLQPIMTQSGKMTHLPDKLKKLLNQKKPLMDSVRTALSSAIANQAPPEPHFFTTE